MTKNPAFKDHLRPGFLIELQGLSESGENYTTYMNPRFHFIFHLLFHLILHYWGYIIPIQTGFA